MRAGARAPSRRSASTSSAASTAITIAPVDSGLSPLLAFEAADGAWAAVVAGVVALVTPGFVAGVVTAAPGAVVGAVAGVVTAALGVYVVVEASALPAAIIGAAHTRTTSVERRARERGRRFTANMLARARARARRSRLDQPGELLERVEQHARRRRAGVDHADPLGLGGGELVVRARDRSEEARLLALEPVGQLAAYGLARAPGSRLDAQQQRAVGLELAGREAVDLAHALDAEAACDALVRERRVDVAIEQHDACRRRAAAADALVHELCARSRVQQRLGARRDVERSDP